MYNIVLLT